MRDLVVRSANIKTTERFLAEPVLSGVEVLEMTIDGLKIEFSWSLCYAERFLRL